LAEQRAVNSKVLGSSPGTPAGRPSVTVAQRSPKPQDRVQFSGAVQCEYGLVVKLNLAKVITRVRFPLFARPISLAVKALPCHGRDRQFKSGMGRKRMVE
jgi:hypothetical protein